MLTGFLEEGSGQQTEVAIADPTAVGGKMTLLAEQPPLQAPAVRPPQAIRVEMAFQPNTADAIVQQVGDGEDDHVVILPHVARWLHLSC